MAGICAARRQSGDESKGTRRWKNGCPATKVTWELGEHFNKAFPAARRRTRLCRAGGVLTGGVEGQRKIQSQSKLSRVGRKQVSGLLARDDIPSGVWAAASRFGLEEGWRRVLAAGRIIASLRHDQHLQPTTVNLTFTHKL